MVFLSNYDEVWMPFDFLVIHIILQNDMIKNILIGMGLQENFFKHSASLVQYPDICK